MGPNTPSTPRPHTAAPCVQRNMRTHVHPGPHSQIHMFASTRARWQEEPRFQSPRLAIPGSEMKAETYDIVTPSPTENQTCSGAAPGRLAGTCQGRACSVRKRRASSCIAATLHSTPAQLTDMQISLIISSSQINYILQWLQYVVSGKITFNIFKLIDVSLEKT